jgi:PKD repeat protein
MNRSLPSLILLGLLFLSTSLFAQSPEQLAQQYLADQQQELKLTNSDITNYRITDLYTGNRNGITYLYANQTIENIDLVGSTANAVFDQSGRLVNMNVRFTADAASQVTSGTATLSAEEALRSVANQLNLVLPASFAASEVTLGPNYTTSFARGTWALEDMKVRMVFFQTPEEGIRLAWEVSYYELSAEHHWLVTIDAATGELLKKYDQVIHCSFGHPEHAHTDECIGYEPRFTHSAQRTTGNYNFLAPNSYLVFPSPIESPNHGDQAVVENPADPIASPFGWHDTDGTAGAEFTITRGNNVHAYQDTGNNNGSVGDEPDGGADLEFNFPYDFDAGPDGFQNAAVVNLFFWCNLVHDVWYQYGFDEQAGNFQQNNYGNGGLQGDYIRAEAQDGSGLNNANFSSGGDGSTARIQMYLWSGGTGDNFFVDEPSSIAGVYNSSGAIFGPGLPSDPLSGTLVLADDGSANPNLGCLPLINGAEIEGNIALIDRGDCFFVDKVTNAQNAGAVAAIICNNVPGAPITMSGDDTGVTIPSIMIEQADCNLIKTELGNGVAVDVTIEDGGSTFFDGDFDNGIIAHEYGHGLSIRMTGGPSTGGCLGNSEQMGEGWSDYIGLIMTIEPGDAGEDIRGIGTFAVNQPTTGTGIRPAPYSTDFGINDYTYGATNNTGLSQPHGVGFVWCTALWEMTWDLIEVYGFDPDLHNGTGGNNIAMHLVNEGMKLQPCFPGFVDGRDAILLADEIFYGGANRCLIWEAFARRGLGFSASQGSSDSRTDQVEAFDLPPFCQEAVLPPNADFMISATESCDGFFSFTDLSTDTPQEWLWEFGNGETSTIANPTYTYDTEGAYTVTLTVTNNLGSDSYSLDVVVDFPDPPVTETEIDVCEGESVILEATGTGTIKWYFADQEIWNGPNYTTPPITNNTQYEVEVSTEGVLENVGPEDNTIGNGGYFDNGTFRGLFFTAHQPFVLESAWIDSPVAGERTFEVYDEFNILISSTTVFVPLGQNIVQLDIVIDAPGDYIIGGSNMNLYRNNSGPSYPYVLQDVVDITDSNASVDGYYYFLYDWQVREKGCASERVLVNVNAVEAPEADFGIIQNDETVSFMDNSINTTSWSWEFGDGGVSDEPNPTYTYSENGTYTVTLTVSNGACEDVYTQTVEISTVSSVANVEGLDYFNLFPNLGSGNFYLQVELNEAQAMQVVIFNTQGQEVMLRQYDRQQRLDDNFDLSNLPSGVYLVRVGWGQQSVTKRYVLIR